MEYPPESFTGFDGREVCFAGSEGVEKSDTGLAGFVLFPVPDLGSSPRSLLAGFPESFQLGMSDLCTHLDPASSLPLYLAIPLLS